MVRGSMGTRKASHVPQETKKKSAGDSQTIKEREKTRPSHKTNVGASRSRLTEEQGR